MRLVHRLAADRFEELERVGHRLHELVILGRERRFADEREVPVLGMVQVREPAVDQRAHEIQRQRGALVAAQHQRRIRLAIGRRERRPIDRVAAIARQRHAVLRLVVGAARLRVLAGHAADADDRLLEPHEHHERHLQQDLELLHDVVRRALVEALGAIAALQQERLAALRLGELRLQVLDFPRRHDRRQPAQVREHALEVHVIAIGGLLRRVPALPARGMPIGRNVGLRHESRAPATRRTIPPGPHGRPKETRCNGPKRRSARSGEHPLSCRHRGAAPMPLAVALLCHPLGRSRRSWRRSSRHCYAAQSQRFVPAFTAVVSRPADAARVPASAAEREPGSHCSCVGIALLHAEFLWPTSGVAAADGLASAAARGARACCSRAYRARRADARRRAALGRSRCCCSPPSRGRCGCVRCRR